MSDLVEAVLAIEVRIAKVLGYTPNKGLRKRYSAMSDEQLAVLQEMLDYDLARFKWAAKNKTRCIGKTVEGNRCSKNAQTADYTCATHADTIPNKKTTVDQGIGKCMVFDKWNRMCAIPIPYGAKRCGFH